MGTYAVIWQPPLSFLGFYDFSFYHRILLVLKAHIFINLFQLAESMLSLFDPTLEDLEDASPSDEKLTPIYRTPKMQAAILPGKSSCQKFQCRIALLMLEVDIFCFITVIIIKFFKFFG